jgi:amino acid transporter
MALKRALGPWQFFSFAFGAIVGVGWIVLLGDWLQRGGPVGATIGFALGGVIMALIGLCYAEASGMIPVAGGEMTFGKEGWGKGVAFIGGWAITLVYTAAAGYCASSLAWILDYLIPGIKGPPLYEFRGTAIHAGSLATAVGTIVVLTWVNLRGVRSSSRFQDWLTYGKIAIALIFIAAGVIGGSGANLQPLFNTDGGRTALGGIVSVLSIVPWFLGGFNILPQIIEERAEGTSIALAGRVTVAAILLGALFYCLVIISGSMAMPWGEMLTRELPAAAAFREAFDSEWLARLVLVTGLFGVATVGNAAMVAASRMLFSMSRESMLGPAFGQTSVMTGVPDRAILFVGLIAGLLTLLGRQGIGPVVAVGAVCMSTGYLITSAMVHKLRRTAPGRERPYRIPGGAVVSLIAALSSALLILAALYDPYAAAGGRIPLEWIILGGWIILGVGFYLRGSLRSTSMVRS